MVVLFDFDEVFVDLNTGAINYVNSKLGTKYKNKDVTSWDFFDQPEVNKHFMDYLALPDCYQNHVIPNVKMINVLKQMVEMGKEAYIVTASVESSTESKYKFIKEHMSFFDTNNLFTVNASSKYKNKSDVLDELNLDYREPIVLIDDGVHNILDMMADLKHKELLDRVMSKFYGTRRLKKFNNPYHEFIYGVVPVLPHNNDIKEEKRVYRLENTKDIWKILDKIEEQHHFRLEAKQAEAFNYLNSIVNVLIPAEAFKEVNELQNNVSYLGKYLLNTNNSYADFLSDVGRFLVKVNSVLNHSDDKEKAIRSIFKGADNKFGSEVMYNEIKDIIISIVAPELFPREAKMGVEASAKYEILNDAGVNVLTSIVSKASENMYLTNIVLAKVNSPEVSDKIYELLKVSGSVATVDFDDMPSMSANINLALNRNLALNTNSIDIETKDPLIEDIKSDLKTLSLYKRPKFR